MYDKKTILTRLQNGETVQTIADEIAKLINETNKEYQAELAAKKASAQKKKEAEAILSLLKDWIVKYYTKSPKEAEAVAKAFDLIKVDEYIQMVEEAVETLTTLPKLSIKTTDSLEEWLEEMGW